MASSFRDKFNLTMFALVGLGTLGGILMTSQAKKIVQHQNKEPSFEEKMEAFARKPSGS